MARPRFKRHLAPLFVHQPSLVALRGLAHDRRDIRRTAGTQIL